MILKVLRPRVWVVRRWAREGSALARAGVVVLLLALLAGGLWLYTRIVGALAVDQIAAVMAGMAPVFLILLVAAALLGVGDVLQSLFLSSDLELLMTAPIPLRTVYLVKLIDCSRVLWLPASLVLVFLIALGHGQSAPVAFFPLAALLVVSWVLGVVCVMMALVMLLVRVIPAQRLRLWIPAALSLVSLGVALAQQALLRESMGLEDWVIASQTVLDAARLGVAVAAASAGALVLAAGTYLLFRATFYYGRSSFAEAAVRRPRRAVRRPRATARVGVGQLLSSQWRSLLLKEWHSLRRDPRQLISVAVGPLMVVGLSAAFARPEGPLGSLLFWNTLFFAVMMGSSVVFNLGLAATSGEGRNVDLLRRLPVPMGRVLRAKFWVSWLSAWLGWLPVLAAAVLLTELTAPQASILAGSLALALAEVGLAGPALGALRSDFAVEEETRRAGGLTGFLALVVAFVSVLLTMLTCALAVISFLPSSELATTTEQALMVLPPVRFVLGGRIVPWLGVILAHGIYLSIVALLWRAGVRRMERWEPA
jgi:ABC-2 type transport system permease protein